jgi:hypothetical protein
MASNRRLSVFWDELNGQVSYRVNAERCVGPSASHPELHACRAGRDANGFGSLNARGSGGVSVPAGGLTVGLELLAEDGIPVRFIESNGETHGPTGFSPTCIVTFQLESEPRGLDVVAGGFEGKYEVFDSVRNTDALRIGVRFDYLSVRLNRFNLVGGGDAGCLGGLSQDKRREGGSGDYHTNEAMRECPLNLRTHRR